MAIEANTRQRSCSRIVQFWLAFSTLILLIVTATSTRWGVLKHKVSGEEVAHFGLWKACKTSGVHGDDVTTCKDFKDGDFTAANFQNQTSLKNVAIYDGAEARLLCMREVNVTVQKTRVVNVTGQLAANVTTYNTTELEWKNFCQMDRLYSFKNLERCRVFSILPAVVSFIVCMFYFIALFKESARGFSAPFVSLLIPLWSLIGVVNFTLFYGNHFDLVTFQYGWTYILAWLTAFLSIGGSLFSFSLLIMGVSKENTMYYEMKCR